MGRLGGVLALALSALEALAGPPPDGEDLPPAVRVAFGRGPGRRRFSGRGAEAGLAKLPRFLVDRLRHVATI